NHYTIATGLRPDRHGIVHNSMTDKELGTFRLSDRDAVGNGDWWGGEPVWVGAEKAGMPTATMFWPGSEAEVAGVRPTRWHLYDESSSDAERAATVAGWLLEPEIGRASCRERVWRPVGAAPGRRQGEGGGPRGTSPRRRH